MQIVIDTMQCPCRTLNDECDISGGECYEDDIYSPCPLIRNGGIKLPKGHGRLIDADAFESRCMFDSSIKGMEDVIYALSGYEPIIEADKESEDER